MVVLHRMDEIDGNIYLKTSNVKKWPCVHTMTHRHAMMMIYTSNVATLILGACNPSIDEMIGE
jgi:hypothetical protein